MSKMTWYHKIPLPQGRTNGRVRKRIANSSKGIERTIAIKNPHNIYRTKNLGTYHHIVGVRVKLFSLNDVAKFLGLNYHTLKRWYKDDALPTPFITFKGQDRSQPMWIAGQINCFVRVLNDIYAGGYVSVPWRSLPRHVGMIEAGAKEAVDRWNRNNTGEKEVDTTDKYGIELHD